MPNGKLITIEGIEGAGKSTAVKYIQQFLQENQQNFILTREPGGTPLAEQIRNIVLKPNDEKLCDDAELLLMFAARAQHISQKIKPALLNGQTVVSDRFVDATYAYQGGGRKLSLAKIKSLEDWIVKNCYPDLTILLDVSPELGLQRAKNRGAHDRIEQESLIFFADVRAAYLERAKEFSSRFRIIDAAQSPDKVKSKILSCLTELFK